jgi:hypothetical protein
MIFRIGPQLLRKYKQELTNGIASNLNAFAQQRKQLSESKENLQSGRKSLPVIHWIKD